MHIHKFGFTVALKALVFFHGNRYYYRYPYSYARRAAGCDYFGDIFFSGLPLFYFFGCPEGLSKVIPTMVLFVRPMEKLS